MAMHDWLRSDLVCPRDHNSLATCGETLICPHGHSYPVVDGIPVMLLDDVEQTLAIAERSLLLANTRSGIVPDAPLNDGIDPFVQKAVADTNGMLYRGLLNQLSRYPIPHLRLPPGHGERLLDLGCNWGRWCIAAARAGYRPVGIDPSLEAILAARNISRQMGLDNAYLVADARFLPFAPATFDVVFSYSVLQHMSDANVELVLAQVAHVLHDDGICLIQMANRYGLRCLYHQIRRRFREPRAFEVRYRRLVQLRELFTRYVGIPSLSVDGYFGLGIQKSDIDLMPPQYRAIIVMSELLRRMSERAPWMIHVADSVYVKAQRSTRNKVVVRPGDTNGRAKR